MNTALIFCHCVLGVDVTVAAGLVEVIEVKHACALPLFFSSLFRMLQPWMLRASKLILHVFTNLLVDDQTGQVRHTTGIFSQFGYSHRCKDYKSYCTSKVYSQNSNENHRPERSRYASCHDDCWPYSRYEPETITHAKV